MGPDDSLTDLPYREAVAEFKRRLIGRVLDECGGNQTKAAEQTGAAAQLPEPDDQGSGPAHVLTIGCVPFRTPQCPQPDKFWASVRGQEFRLSRL